jgi:FG-GAP-like repeat
LTPQFGSPVLPRVALPQRDQVDEIPTDITGFTGKGSADRLIVGDVNGDGRHDTVFRRKIAVNWSVALSNGSGFHTSVPTDIPVLGSTAQQMRPVDFDRDGQMDMLAEVPDDSKDGTGWKLFRSNGHKLVAYNNGSGGNIAYFGPDDKQLDPVYFVDLNGDGLPDFLTAKYDFEPPRGIQISTGRGGTG